MKIYKITEASDYLGVSINTLVIQRDTVVQEVAERRGIRLKTCLPNLMEFEKELMKYYE